MKHLLNVVSISLSTFLLPARITSLHYKSISNGVNKTINKMEYKRVETKMITKLTEKLNPVHLEVINESFMHNVPKDSETHFKVIVVSEIFNDLPLLKRHRLVNEILDLELQTDVHALSIVAKTPAQWEESDKKIEPSPACRGGFGK